LVSRSGTRHQHVPADQPAAARRTAASRRQPRTHRSGARRNRAGCLERRPPSRWAIGTRASGAADVGRRSSPSPIGRASCREPSTGSTARSGRELAG
jgi:hypothetical protein